MHRDRLFHPHAVLDRLVDLVDDDPGFLQHTLLGLSHDQQLVLAQAIDRLQQAPWTVVRDERVALTEQAWPPEDPPEPQLVTVAHVLEELDERGLLPQAVRRVQARLTINPGGSQRGDSTIELGELGDGGGTVAWYWDLEVGFGGTVAWADEWLPGPPTGGLWVSAADDGRNWHEVGRVDAELATLRLQRLRARQLRLGWVEGGWGQGLLVGLGFAYGERWSTDLAQAVDEVLVALAPAVGRLTLLPAG